MPASSCAAGEVGEIRHFRARYLQDWGDTDAVFWRFDAAAAGSGALGDLAAHVVDLAAKGSASSRPSPGSRARSSRDEPWTTRSRRRCEFEEGAVGTIEATRLAEGRRNALQWEVNGTKGSVAFDVERLNELELNTDGGPGFRRVLVTEPDHPFMEYWWPPGHIVGWGDSFDARGRPLPARDCRRDHVAPHGATFEDGYRAAEVCDAIVRSGATGARQELSYRWS